MVTCTTPGCAGRSSRGSPARTALKCSFCLWAFFPSSPCHSMSQGLALPGWVLLLLWYHNEMTDLQPACHSQMPSVLNRLVASLIAFGPCVHLSFSFGDPSAVRMGPWHAGQIQPQRLGQDSSWLRVPQKRDSQVWFLRMGLTLSPPGRHRCPQGTNGACTGCAGVHEAI